MKGVEEDEDREGRKPDHQGGEHAPGTRLVFPFDVYTEEGFKNDPWDENARNAA